LSVTTTKKIDEVKKALACCIVRNPDERRTCPECPYRDPEAYCANRLMVDALKTIETLSMQLNIALDTINAPNAQKLEAALSEDNDVECESCRIEEG